MPADERNAFLAHECGDDPQLQAEVASLLESAAAGEQALERSPVDLAGGLSANAQPPADAIPGYRILHEIHRGGQGVVYQAIQRSTKRKVVLKIMLEGPFAGPASRRRFEREIELVGSLRHPGIVTIFDSGIAHGQAFYAMEYIRGKRLHEFVREHTLSVVETVRLFVKVCDAVDYAHQNGVIHRDLKPSNILVDEHGEPHVLDFGLAKAGGSQWEADGRTAPVSMTGQVMGTLAYMSPEQAGGKLKQIDLRSDAYSLGVVLYELLADRLPYSLDGTLAENLSAIQTTAPHRLELDSSRSSREVDTIVQKALSKDKTRRYPTAGAFGEDLQRFLRGEAIDAKRDSALYLLGKLVKRHVVPFSGVVVVAALVLLSSVVAWYLYLEGRQARVQAGIERDRADRRALELTRTLYFAQMNLAGQEMQHAGGVGRLRELIAEWRPAEAGIDLRGWEWYRLATYSRRERSVLTGHDSTVWCAAWSPDGRRIASSTSGDGTIRIWDVTLGRQTATIETYAGRWLDWSPDGKRLASGSFGGTVMVWDAYSQKPLAKLTGHDSQTVVRCVQWSPDGKRLASSSNHGELIIWNVESGDKQVARTGIGRVASLAWSPAGDRIATLRDGVLEIYDADSGKLVSTESRHDANGECVGWSPDGDRIATSGKDGRVVISRVADGSADERVILEGTGTIWSVSWRPDSKQLATAGEDRAVRIWDAKTGRLVESLPGHVGSVLSVQWNPAGTQLVSTGVDRSVRVWDVDSPDLTRHWPKTPGITNRPQWSRDDGRLLIADTTGRFRVLDPVSGTEVLNVPIEGTDGRQRKEIQSVRWSPDDQRIATGGHGDFSIRVWSSRTGEELTRIEGHTHRVMSLDWHPKGDRLAAGDTGGMLHVWHLENGTSVHRHQTQGTVRAIAFNPDATRLAWAAVDDQGPMVMVQSGDTVGVAHETTRTLRGHSDEITALCWSHDGKFLATASRDRSTLVWNAATGRRVGTAMSHGSAVQAVAWSPHPDRPRLATATNNGTVQLWDPLSGKLVLTMPLAELTVNGVAWTRDGTRLAAFSRRGIHIWDAGPAYRRR